MPTSNPLDPINFALYTHHVLRALGDFEVGQLDAAGRTAISEELTGLFSSLTAPGGMPTISVGTLRLIASPLGTALLGTLRAQPSKSAGGAVPNVAVYLDEAKQIKVDSGTVEERRQRVARLRGLFERVAQRAAHDLVPNF